MELIENAIAHLPMFSTVLVACHSEVYRDELVRTLVDRGICILGPVYTAGHALALAARADVDLAIVEAPPAEPGGGHALVRRLKETWGIPSLLLRAPASAG
jgi:hypothetical protein